MEEEVKSGLEECEGHYAVVAPEAGDNGLPSTIDEAWEVGILPLTGNSSTR